MGRPCSMDLRARVMAAVQGGLSYEEAVARFRARTSSILRWARRLRETGSFAVLPMGGKKPFVLAEQRAWMRERLAANARSVEATWRGIGETLNLFSPTECANYFKNAGYQST